MSPPLIALDARKTQRQQQFGKDTKYLGMYLLPRFVEKSKDMNGVHKLTKRKLEPGDFDVKSKLYPLLTPISEMLDFGALKRERFKGRRGIKVALDGT